MATPSSSIPFHMLTFPFRSLPFFAIGCCSAYTLSSTDTSVQSFILGSYTDTGIIANDRPVFQNENNQYLFYTGTGWLAGSDYQTTSGWVSSPEDSDCPPSTGYQIYTGGSWEYTFDVSVVCLSEYALISSGTCQSNSRVEVPQGDCETAAASLGLSDTGVDLNEYSARPPGCIYVTQPDAYDILRFNTLETSVTSCGSGDYNYDCICGALAPPTPAPPTTPPPTAPKAGIKVGLLI